MWGHDRPLAELGGGGHMTVVGGGERATLLSLGYDGGEEEPMTPAGGTASGGGGNVIEEAGWSTQGPMTTWESLLTGLVAAARAGRARHRPCWPETLPPARAGDGLARPFQSGPRAFPQSSRRATMA